MKQPDNRKELEHSFQIIEDIYEQITKRVDTNDKWVNHNADAEFKQKTLKPQSKNSLTQQSDRV